MLKAYAVGVGALAVLFGAFIIWLGIQAHQPANHTPPIRGSFTVTFPNGPNYTQRTRST